LLSLALDPNPELLVLDEPAAGIDFADHGPFYELLGQINRETGLTMLLVSHDLSVIAERAHHVICLKNGRVECQGPPSAVLADDSLQRAYGLNAATFASR
jgi:zinc transport system ATP-binding protein